MTKYIPGLLLSNLIALLSIYVFNNDYLGSIPIAIILGFVFNMILDLNKGIFSKGISFAEKKVLDIAIILLGAKFIFDVNDIFKIISFAILIIIVSILSCYLIGRILNVPKSLSLLLGIGNGICGSAAIAACSKILEVKEEEIGISITIINFLGVLLLFSLPSLPFIDNDYIGYIIGGSIQAMGQVIGSADLVTTDVAQYQALQTKMIRILMLGPAIIIIGSLIKNSKIKNNRRSSISIPFFILGFILIAAIRNLPFIDEIFFDSLGKISKYLLTVSMAGIGLKISFKKLLNFGYRPIIVASSGAIIQVMFAILLVNYFFI